MGVNVPNFLPHNTKTGLDSSAGLPKNADALTKKHRVKVQESELGPNKQVNKVSIETLNKPRPQVETPIMKSYVPTHPKATEIAKQIKFDPELEELSVEQKQEIVDECIESYQESVKVFETTIAELAAKHSDSKKFAEELVERVGKIAKAYQEILIEDNKSLSPVIKELKIRLVSNFIFASEGTGTGSIGFNPIAIEKAMKNGSFREQMTLACSCFWQALPKIFEKPEMIDKINAKLDAEDVAFQINTEALDEKRKTAKKGENPTVSFFAQSKPLALFRQSGGRIRNERSKELGSKFKDLKDLTIREARATLGTYISEKEFKAMKEGREEGVDLGEHRVQWVRGKDLYRVNEKTDFFKKAVALGGLPIVTGPSGTTHEYMLAIKYLNMNGFEKSGILALTGWMVRAGDHSYHEIKEAATWHGVDYTPGPDSFENVYPDDPGFQKELNNSMQKQGKTLPGDCLKSEHQLQIAKKLRFID